ncbi:methionyl-tRNA formyltransferase [Salipiger bermudensis]|uniref:methionyl-tRNA formyltransferase n=1 Tax=Salipiger bermudensis TaxID=344736 RepID=UPI003518A09C
MRLVFAGTPDFAATALKALIAAGHTIVGVYSQPDRPAGRGRKLQPSPVKQVALDHEIPVFQPETLKTAEAQKQLADLKPDVMIVAAYGLILPKAVLDIPTHGCLNIHASLLPRWRGAAPIHRAILSGDAQTGICIMQMEAGLDTGPVLLREATEIGAEETTGELHDRLSAMGAGLIVQALSQLDSLTPEVQPEEGVTYAQKIDKAEAAVDWTRPAEEISRQIRGLAPFPGAWTLLGEHRIKLLGARVVDGQGAPGTALDDSFTIACGTGAVQVTRAQRAGKGAQDSETFLRGMAIPQGATLGAG